MTETRFEFLYYVTEGEVRVVLEGLEVMKLQLNSSNLSEALFSKITSDEPEPFLRMADAEQRERIYAGVRERFEKQGMEVSDEILRQHEDEALIQMGRLYLKESIEAATKRVGNNLPRIMEMINDKVLKAAFFGGANKLREILEQPEQKYSAREIKDAIFEEEWKQIKPLIGVTTGGARNVKHVWSDQDRACLASKYAELQPIWIEAKKIAKIAQQSSEPTRKKGWRKEVLAVYSDLPPDLLERFTTLRGDDTKPSNIAILHAGRLCLPANVELSIGRLRDELKTWKNKNPT